MGEQESNEAIKKATMETAKDYKALIIWQKSDSVFDMVREDTTNWQSTRITNAIGYQLIRAAGSISANIGEGYGRLIA
jgi:hypothetical protein